MNILKAQLKILDGNEILLVGVTLNSIFDIFADVTYDKALIDNKVLDTLNKTH